jgi:diguanylate cyclase (GGDEF)-like protein
MMSLLKTMMMGVLSLIILVFLGTYFITLNNDKNYFVAQMQSNAQDTATSLGLSLSHAMKDNDKLTTLSMVQAVFDRGYFSSILVNDIEGKTIVSRFRANSNEIVPRWFISFLDLKLVPASALVMSGWNQMGEVLVTTDINYVYEALWKNAEGLFLWYLFFAILSVSLVIFFIKWLLRPLQRVTAQALSICNREFPIEQNIPKSLELKQVTTAMNKMVRKLKRIFSEQLQQATQLREDAFIDSLTGLFNRRFFLQQLSSLIAQTDDFTPGIVGVIAIQGLDALNHVKGYVEGDNLIQEISAELKILNEKNERLICSRVGGSQFTFLYQSPPLDFVSETVQSLKATLNTIALKYEAIKIHIAFIPYISGATVSDTLTTMDKALHGVISDVVAEPSYSLPAQVSLPLLKKLLKSMNLFYLNRQLNKI